MYVIRYQNHLLITTSSFLTDQKQPRSPKTLIRAKTCSRRLAVHLLPPSASSKPRKTEEFLCVAWRPGMCRQAVPSPGTQNCTKGYEPPGGFEDSPGSFWKISRNVKLYSFNPTETSK